MALMRTTQGSSDKSEERRYMCLRDRLRVGGICVDGAVAAGVDVYERGGGEEKSGGSKRAKEAETVRALA